MACSLSIQGKIVSKPNKIIENKIVSFRTRNWSVWSKFKENVGTSSPVTLPTAQTFSVSIAGKKLSIRSSSKVKPTSFGFGLSKFFFVLAWKFEQISCTLCAVSFSIETKANKQTKHKSKISVALNYKFIICCKITLRSDLFDQVFNMI